MRALLLLAALAGVAGTLVFAARARQAERKALAVELRAARLQDSLGAARSAPPPAAGALSAGDLAELTAAGFASPAELADSLRAHRELIPQAGVHGGTMRFDRVVLLPNGKAWASYEDGHIAGSMLLEYRVAPGRRVTWRVPWSTLE